MAMEVVLVIPDLHIPFQHKDALRFLKALKRKYKPSEVVCLGDEVDFHSISRWPTDPDGHSPGHELSAALVGLGDFYKEFPKVKVCTSNHTVRPLKAALEIGLPRAFMKSYKEFLMAPRGWIWKDKWVIDGVVYEHGEGVSGQNGHTKAALHNMQSTVVGHIHSFAGYQYIASSNKLIFGMNCGCLIDKDAYAFSYGKKLRVKPVLGAGIVNKGVPQFIPMLLNKEGSWIGRL